MELSALRESYAYHLLVNLTATKEYSLVQVKNSKFNLITS